LDNSALEQDGLGTKRKLESEETNGKRARQKTDSEPPEESSTAALREADQSSAGPPASETSATQATTMPVTARPRQRPSRRKIEYVPLAREVDTFGGRDLKLLESEMAGLSRRQLRDINDWGTVDIEALTMSIRSRIAIELSYALTTFTLLSTMRGQTPNSGFPVHNCVDLFDEVLDLLEERAFDSAEDLDEPGDPPIPTHRELVDILHETESQPFAGLERRQGSKDFDEPGQRSGSIVLAIFNIIRNLSTIPDNWPFISQHERLIDLVLRTCKVSFKDGSPCAASPVLSLGDLVTVRKDTLYTLMNIANTIHFSDNSRTSVRIASRAFQLISSYLVDPAEAVSPLACIQLAGVPLSGSLKPPSLADVALETFTRLSQSDTNRQMLGKAVSQASLFQLFASLVHRLPVLDADFQLVGREQWLSYTEKNIMAIYSLAFLAPPELRRKIKADRPLGFKGIMLRVIQKFLMAPSPEARAYFLVCARRAIEAMKVLDDSEESLDNSETTTPIMSFGMGYGEIGDNGGEKGTGLLGGHRELAWEMLMLREVCGDEVMFGELESLARVE